MGLTTKRIVCTGPRDYYPWDAVKREFRKLPHGSTIVHGKCPTGVDKVVDTVAREMGFSVVPYPADWDGMAKLGKPRGAAGPLRNAQMTRENAHADELQVYVPDPETFDPQTRGSGTSDCVRCAIQVGLTYRTIGP